MEARRKAEEIERKRQEEEDRRAALALQVGYFWFVFIFVFFSNSSVHLGTTGEGSTRRYALSSTIGTRTS